MKIAIVTDMEGVAGVVNFDDWVNPTSRYYEQGRELLTEETNAAIRGFFDGGADEIVVIDGHGSGAINPLLLDERTYFSRGWAVYHQFGLNDNFDAVAWVGQHAKAGTLCSHLTHTGMPIVIDSRINGISVGETGKAAMIAGFYGASPIFAAGEEALEAELKELGERIHFVSVKRGVTMDNGLYLDTDEYEKHNLGAVHIHPKEARRRIYKGAREAIEDFIQNRCKFPPVCPPAPYIMETWYRKHGDKPAFKTIQRHDNDLMKLFSAPREVLSEGEYELPYEFVSIEEQYEKQ